MFSQGQHLPHPLLAAISQPELPSMSCRQQGGSQQHLGMQLRFKGGDPFPLSAARAFISGTSCCTPACFVWEVCCRPCCRPDRMLGKPWVLPGNIKVPR